ncbi:MAG: hypothetical protein LBV75_01910 [Paludibacter sp.]|jgi:hypothetical protein|nr:hypothetical protein [Paludibacter sp.]
MIYKEQQFIKVIEQSFKMYREHGPQSPEKLKPLHKYLADVLLDIWGKEYEVHYYGDKNAGDTSKEKKITGKYNDKNIDITVTKDNVPIFCVGVKFVSSNYKQNAYNYFEGMMGETANIQRIDVPYAHIIVLPQKLPYFDKQGNITKYEIIKDNDIQKYVNLVFDIQNPHKPFTMGFFVIDINQDNTICANDLQSFSREIAQLLQNKLSMSTFFNEINAYKDYLKIKK